MKRIFLFAASFALSTLIGCSDEASFQEPWERLSSASMTGELFDARCLDDFGITESDAWSATLSDSSYISDVICERTGLYLDEMSGTYARCVSSRYDASTGRFNMEILTERGYSHVWSEVSGCESRLGSDGDFAALVARTGEFVFDKCLCKIENGVTYYRNMAQRDSGEISSSSSSNDTNSFFPDPWSSSEAPVSSSSSDMLVSSSSAAMPVDEGEFVKIGGQEWMTRNLDVDVDGSMCYDDNPENCEKYGRIYTWAMAMGVELKYDREQLGEVALPYKGICPEGSHLPSHEEWNKLNEIILENPEYLAYFQNQYGGAYDYRGYYRDAGTEVNFMSSTEYDVSGTSYPYAYAWLWYIHDDYTYFYKDNGHKYTGAYVRCVKN